MVVEEALNNGIPVIVSDRVGCRDDLVSEKNGIVFPYSDIKALKEAIIKMTDIEYYNTLRVNISQMNFIARGQHQIEIFTKESNDTPILLLDDVFSELDNNKKNNLLDIIMNNNIQTIITTTDIDNIDDNILKESNLIKVENGKCSTRGD